MKSSNLLEILIIIIVISILSWITFNQFNLAKAKSRDVDRRANLNEVAKAIRLYYADYGELPSDEIINSLWGKPWIDNGYTYMAKVPKENFLNKEFCYQASADGKTFTFFAELENKSDVDCKKIEQICNNQSYCFINKLESVVIKI
ncbi:MAG: type II secretion system protein GspG [Candidatus Shapirobacteria bacterium]|jgi:Tfp pilus assembly protein PilE